MPNIPSVRQLNASTVDILNAIRNDASANYQNYVPAATDDASIREIGITIMNYTALQNEFLSALVNRIGMTIIQSKMYSNPWAAFKRGVMEFGETIEEIFVNIAAPHNYDIETAENEVFKRAIPDVRAAYHVLNYQKFYKATIQEKQLKQAFLSIDGVRQLIAGIVNSMYSGANYDEFLVMKYLLARHILNGKMSPQEIQPTTAANVKGNVAIIKAVSNQLSFASNKYNLAGVTTYSNKEDQFIIVNSEFDAVMDVEVLAAAFNMDKAEFMGRRVLVDSFGTFDTARLEELMADEPNYTPFTEDELNALAAIPALLVDRDWFMILDNMIQFTENFNGEGIYWNYWLHVWKTFSASPFANAVVFVPGAPAVNTITISPATATVQAGQSAQLTVTVDTDYFAPQAVNWSVNEEAAEYATVDIYGKVTIAEDAESASTVTVTATSVFDNAKTATATITVA